MFIFRRNVNLCFHICFSGAPWGGDDIQSIPMAIWRSWMWFRYHHLWACNSCFDSYNDSIFNWKVLNKLNCKYSANYKSFTMCICNIKNVYLNLRFRYLAICHPLKPSLQSGKRRTAITIVLIWVICLIPSVCWSIYSEVF